MFSAQLRLLGERGNTTEDENYPGFFVSALSNISTHVTPAGKGAEPRTLADGGVFMQWRLISTVGNNCFSSRDKLLAMLQAQEVDGIRRRQIDCWGRKEILDWANILKF